MDLGLFGKKNKAEVLDQCGIAFALIRTDEKTPEPVITYANFAMADLLHMELADLIAKPLSCLDETIAENRETLKKLSDTSLTCRRYLEKQGIIVQLTVFPVENGCVGLLMQDYTEVVRKLVKGISGKEIGIFYYDMARDIVIADTSMIRHFGGGDRYDGFLASFVKEWVDETYADLLRAQLEHFPSENDLIEVNLRMKNGRFVHLSLSADLTSREETLAVGYMEDISNAPTFAEQAERDTLTGLFHTVSAKERIDDAIMACYDSGRIDAMILLDLDHFDSVNETCGYEAGDEMLKKVAEILKNNFKGKDIIARPGGDAFIVYVSDLNDKRSALQICRTLNKLVTQTVPRENAEPLRITASIGVAFSCDNGGNYEKLYQSALAALEETKSNGRNGYTLA
ncbi:MAG: GGDEF domain-containing protein [Lachnospiraceae bacterium]|nr:GGDEF domain-containing protein [Lachnospiraceae bacterium]